MDQQFQLGQRVRHKSQPNLDMVIKEFAVHWHNNLQKIVEQEQNPDYPICSYLNPKTGRFEEQTFSVHELESIEDPQ